MPPFPGRTAVTVLLALLGVRRRSRRRTALPPLPTVEQQIAASRARAPEGPAGRRAR